MRQLRAFLAVAREGNFTHAAARLRLTQSALTQSIKALEAEVGAHLLDRSTRSVQPTVQGRRFISVSERLLEEMERALDDLWAHAERERGLVVVAATASIISRGFAPALRSLATRFPGISVRLLEEQTSGALRRLLAGEVDFAVTTLPSPEPAVEAVPLVRDRFGLLCPADHPLALIQAPAWRALADHPLLGFSTETGTRVLLERNAGEIGPLPRPRYETSSVAGLRRLVEEGLGVAAMPALTALPPPPGLTFRPLVPPLHRVVNLAVRPRRSPSPAASAVVAALLDALDELAGPHIEVAPARPELSRLGFETDAGIRPAGEARTSRLPRPMAGSAGSGPSRIQPRSRTK